MRNKYRPRKREIESMGNRDACNDWAVLMIDVLAHNGRDKSMESGNHAGRQKRPGDRGGPDFAERRNWLMIAADN